MSSTPPTPSPLPRPKSWETFQLERLSPKASKLQLHPQLEILFFEAEPISVFTGGIVYFNGDTSAARTLLINQYHIDQPHVRSAAPDFDFILGQALTMAGLPLTRRQS